MMRSPEEYLSGMDFTAPEKGRNSKSFNASERAFVEKYLGLDAYEKLPLVSPGVQSPQPRPVKTIEPPQKIKVSSPEIIVVRDEKPEVPPAPPSAPVQARLEPKIAAPPQKVETKPEAPAAKVQEPPRGSVATLTMPPPPKAESPDLHVAHAKVPPAADAEINTEVPDRAKTPPKIEPEPAKAPERQVEQKATPSVVEMALDDAANLKAQLKQENEIQMVSFFVASQLFLLPVAGIREVLRHQELVKVPQAPDFVAGVINLRGTVTPLVHLSALLTNAAPVYNEKNFIIICGAGGLQLGLIIDRINSMHVLPQNKIIWNAEAKLGESAEFLWAIADLDDKVCGIVGPETITQKLLAK